MDVRSARRTRVFAVHCFDHRQRDRPVLARRNEQQRRALWVRKIEGIHRRPSPLENRCGRGSARCSGRKRGALALRQRIGDRRGKALKRHRRNAPPTAPQSEDGKRGPNRGNARQHAAGRSGNDCYPSGAHAAIKEHLDYQSAKRMSAQDRLFRQIPNLLLEVIDQSLDGHFCEGRIGASTQLFYWPVQVWPFRNDNTVPFGS